MTSQAAIVDLSRNSDEIITMKEGTYLGKFYPHASELSYELAKSRALNIISKLDSPNPLTFFVNVNWQSFAIVATVAGYFGVKPRVIVIMDGGKWIDLIEFYDGSLFETIKKGGDELNVMGVSVSEQVQVPKTNEMP